MTRIENKIKEVVPNGTPLFNIKDYKGDYLTKSLKKDEECYIVTTKLTRKAPLLMQCKVVDRYSNCMNCPFADYNCNIVACNLDIIKIYRV